MSKKSRIWKNRQNQQNLRKSKDHYNEHHVYPSSRRKRGDLGKFKVLCNSLKICVELEKHNAWHHLFENLFAEEVILLIKKAAKTGKHTIPDVILFFKHTLHPHRTSCSLANDDLEAWHRIFGSHTNLRAIKKIVKKDWMYPGVHATVSGDGKIVKMTVFLPKIIKSGCRGIQVSSLKEGQLLTLNR